MSMLHRTPTVGLVASLLLTLGVAVAADEKTQTITADALTFKVPADWKKETPKSQMRKAQIKISPVKGDDEPAELLVFAFPNGAGTAASNIDRWEKQFVDADKKTPKAKVEKKKGINVDVTRVEVSGRFVAADMTGTGTKADKPSYRLLGRDRRDQGHRLLLQAHRPGEDRRRDLQGLRQPDRVDEAGQVNRIQTPRDARPHPSNLSARDLGEAMRIVINSPAPGAPRATTRRPDSARVAGCPWARPRPTPARPSTPWGLTRPPSRPTPTPTDSSATSSPGPGWKRPPPATAGGSSSPSSSTASRPSTSATPGSTRSGRSIVSLVSICGTANDRDPRILLQMNARMVEGHFAIKILRGEEYFVVIQNMPVDDTAPRSTPPASSTGSP